MNNNIIKENNDFSVEYKDTCIVCNKASEENKSTNVHLRQFYVEGAGQLCRKCFKLTYKNDKLFNNYTDL